MPTGNTFEKCKQKYVNMAYLKSQTEHFFLSMFGNIFHNNTHKWEWHCHELI